jgi:hypothetical protein
MDIYLGDDADSIRIKGEVAHASRIGMGIEFEKVNSNLLEKLGNLLYKII